jgi:putative acetyltransferase
MHAQTMDCYAPEAPMAFPEALAPRSLQQRRERAPLHFPSDWRATTCVDADAEALFFLFDQPDFRRLAMMDPEPFASPEAVRAWLAAGRGTAFTMAVRIGETIVGFAGLYPLPGRQNHVGCLTMMVHEAYRGRGIGTAMLRLVLATAEHLLGLRRVQLHVLADNLAAISLYSACGFHIEGRHRGMVRSDDVFVDAYTMAHLL